jgi:hypothetical protein
LRALFFLLLTLLIAFEIGKSYLILPFPGSQESNTVEFAWFLHHYRWMIRVVLIIAAALTIKHAFQHRKWIAIIVLLLSGLIFYATNFVMIAEQMFHTPEHLEFSTSGKDLPNDAVIVAVSHGNTHRAYPVRYLSFHHQIYDTLDGKRLLITYCDVCRSALVFDPVVNGTQENFRLVGMDQYNALIEDSQTGSWWRQATGECVAGSMKGTQLRLWPFSQMTFEEFKERFSNGTVMNPVEQDLQFYDTDGSFEKGKDTDPLTASDTASWKDKSWVVGVTYRNCSRAYDWNDLKKMRVIHDTLCNSEIVVTIDSNNVDFHAYKINQQRWITPMFDSIGPASEFKPGFNNLEPLQTRQMFWHTWKTFFPQATYYDSKIRRGSTLKSETE